MSHPRPLRVAELAYLWWLHYTFDNPIRRLFHKPEQILGGLVQPGQTVLDLGCGMGYFSIPMARLVGPGGRVIAVDVQEKVLNVARRRAARAGVLERIRFHRCRPDDVGIFDAVDFVLAFWMVHEAADPARLLCQVRQVLKPEGRFLMAEPKVHVRAVQFEHSVKLAALAGLQAVAQVPVALSRAALFTIVHSEQSR